MNFDKVKDSGIREQFNTGSKRDTQQGKGRPDLIPIEPLRRLAKHYENGANKYGDRNWEKGQPLSRYYASAMRHMWDYMEGDYSEDHLAAAAWNIFALIATQERIIAGELSKELDDISAVEAYNDYMLEEGSRQFITADDIQVEAIKAKNIKSTDIVSDIDVTHDKIPIHDITLSVNGKVISKADDGYILKKKQPVINAGELLITVKVDTSQATEALTEFSNILDDINSGLETLEDKTPEGYTRIMSSGLYKIPNVDTPMTISEIMDYYNIVARDNKKENENK